MIDLTLNSKQRARNAERCRRRGIIIPRFRDMRDPTQVPQKIRDQLADIGLWDIHPRNLFRITWKNDPVPKGGGFGPVNAVLLPPELVGVEAPIVALVGKWFPTGAHKVGATFGCIVPALVTGQFDPANQKAVWPSTGNFCRGGAYVASLLACDSIAILPEEMSKERFEWLSRVAGEVIATPGCESNVKEIFDKCRELSESRDDIVIFNQFDAFGNHLWHYQVTGPALEEVFRNGGPPKGGGIFRDGRFFSEKAAPAGVVLSSGSAGTLGCADYLKTVHPTLKVAVGEALQCPTLLYNGFGGHRIEGIGDKHVPWIHNVRNTDVVVGVDDELTIRLLRLFNEKEGREWLRRRGVSEAVIQSLDLLGISSIGNLIAAVKFARYYELGEMDLVFTVFTDSTELYGSRLRELRQSRGPYTNTDAVADYEALMGITTDHTVELGYYDRKRIHNLKYYTWVEQQGKEISALNAQWTRHKEYWGGVHEAGDAIDGLIEEFNGRVGLLK